MDFTVCLLFQSAQNKPSLDQPTDRFVQLSLAHFCELHGPTSVLCTQALPTFCSTCVPTTHDQSPSSDPFKENPGDSNRPLSRAERLLYAVGGNDGERCHSCRLSLPKHPQTSQGPTNTSKKGTSELPALRSKEEMHVCSQQEVSGLMDGYGNQPHSYACDDSTLSCHSHSQEYVSGTSPMEPEVFSKLRRATVRTLSGEQLPRGHTSGPLWFGDASTGYTIAYIFKLHDAYARGRFRNYALLALVGPDTQRAFEACTLIWSLFEEIAVRIVDMAKEVRSRNDTQESSWEHSDVNPVSSLLIGRKTDPDGFPRHDVANLKANGLAELVDNENFFCELHIMFVGMLQNLGKLLGGMRINHDISEKVTGKDQRDLRSPNDTSNQVIDHRETALEEEGNFRMSPAETDQRFSEAMQIGLSRHSSSVCSPTMTTQPRQVAV